MASVTQKKGLRCLEGLPWGHAKLQKNYLHVFIPLYQTDFCIHSSLLNRFLGYKCRNRMICGLLKHFISWKLSYEMLRDICLNVTFYLLLHNVYNPICIIESYTTTLAEVIKEWVPWPDCRRMWQLQTHAHLQSSRPYSSGSFSKGGQGDSFLPLKSSRVLDSMSLPSSVLLSTPFYWNLSSKKTHLLVTCILAWL